MSNHQKSANFIGSIFAIINVVIMIIVTASVYKNVENKERIYSCIWWMMIPITFSIFIAVLFAGGCIIPYFPNSDPKRKIFQNLEAERTTPDSIFVQEVSNYPIETRGNCDPVTIHDECSSSSRSFFASGETEIQLGYVNPVKRYGAVPKSKGKASEKLSFTQFENKRAQDIMVHQLRLPIQRGRIASDGAISEPRFNYQLPRAASVHMSGYPKRHASSFKGTNEMKNCATSQSKQEKNPLLGKANRQPISILKDPISYGATGVAQNLHSFHIREFVPKFAGAEKSEHHIFPQPISTTSKAPEFKSPDAEKCDTWSFVEYKPPVFYFSPAIIPTKDEREIQEIEETKEIKEISPRVELELPKFDATHRVTDWLNRSNLKEAEYIKTREITTKKKSLVSSLKAEVVALKNEEKYPSNLNVAQKRQLTDEENSSGFKVAKTDKMNRFCILGRGYFYATETNDYLPVDLSLTDENKALAASLSSDINISISPKD